jgi:hypothetical protein
LARSTCKHGSIILCLRQYLRMSPRKFCCAGQTKWRKRCPKYDLTPSLGQPVRGPQFLVHPRVFSKSLTNIWKAHFQSAVDGTPAIVKLIRKDIKQFFQENQLQSLI